MRIQDFIFRLLLLMLLPLSLFGQTSSIKGVVLDQQSEMPIIGATVVLVQAGTDGPAIGAMTDTEGNFALRNVPTGRQVIRITYLGYEPMTVPNVLVNAGKEVQLNLKMQESYTKINEVTITAKVDKDKPVNELATVSARQFDVESVQRYSGGRSDVSRLVANFAGVATSNDARNDIVIRGNSPTGVLWRMEGIPIPNPNHFSTLGTTGGPVSALNPNLIATSDFLTGAFPAEYGNALAGVFDINLRRGNKDRSEFMFQLGAFTGFEGMAEGPLGKNKKGSYVVAYRHSFVEVASAAGMNVGTAAIPRYKDLTFNVDFGNSKTGKWSVFGIAATSAIDFIGAELDTTDLFANPNKNSYNVSGFGVFGIKNNLLLNDHAYIRTVLSASYASNTFTSEDLELREADGRLLQTNDVSDRMITYRLSSYYNNKITNRLTSRTGILVQQQQLDTRVDSRSGQADLDEDGIPDRVTMRDFDGGFALAEAYTQAQYRVTGQVTLNAGLHGQYFEKTNDFAFEPRAAVNWQFAPRQKISLGYGLHNQTQPLPVFLFKERLPDGTTVNKNDALEFTRNQHLVLGYDFKPTPNLRIKAEAYYQWLNNVPVEANPTSFSILNAGANFVFPDKGSLVNEGTGYNKGVELTVEKFFSKGWYSLVTVSLFDSRYKGSDGIERETAFNGKYVFNVLAGKEFKLGDSGRRFLTLDTKLTHAGGRPYTPVNLEASRLAGREILYEDRAFSERLDDYFRWDVKIGLRMNSLKRKLSQTFFLDFQNVTNHANIFALQYNEVRGTIGRVDQIGFFPDILYRVEF